MRHRTRDFSLAASKKAIVSKKRRSVQLCGGFERREQRCSAIGDAAKLIERGDADIALAGGSEAAITGLGVAGFAASKALSKRNDDPERASRPFDNDRDGFVMGEGCGIVVLERKDRAIARGAKIHAELVGYGMSSDAYHITAPRIIATAPRSRAPDRTS